MATPRDSWFSNRVSRIVLALTVATSVCAAVAAAPSAPPSKVDLPTIAVPLRAAFGESATGLRPLGRGAVIHVGRAYDAEDEDCTLIVTKITEADGRVRVTRNIACAN
jgi:hypothetical protein